MPNPRRQRTATGTTFTRLASGAASAGDGGLSVGRSGPSAKEAKASAGSAAWGPWPPAAPHRAHPVLAPTWASARQWGTAQGYDLSPPSPPQPPKQDDEDFDLDDLIADLPDAAAFEPPSELPAFSSEPPAGAAAAPSGASGASRTALQPGPATPGPAPPAAVPGPGPPPAGGGADRPAPVGAEPADTPADPVGDSVAVGGDERGLAVNGAMRALARAARSFLLYDPSNEAIRVFLGDYQAATREALRHGPIGLDIRPFELVLAVEDAPQQVVYVERDRERSLAFRLFRDGVRRLSIRGDVPWDELLRLLEILSIRYTGIRQQEDDIVTLLWKAGFKGIEIVAVEGFVPDAEDEVATAGATKGRRRKVSDHSIEAPPDFDLPLPKLGRGRAVAYRAIPPELSEPLRHEASSAEVAETALHLVLRLLQVVGDATHPLGLRDFVPLVSEVRDFLLAEDQVAQLHRLATWLRGVREDNPDTVDALLATFVNDRALRKLIHSVPASQTEPQPELVELLDLVPRDHLSNLIAVLGQERGAASRRVTRQLVEKHIAGRADFLLDQMREVSPEVARDLLRAYAGVVPAGALGACEALAGMGHSDVQYEILRITERAGADVSEQVVGVLVTLLGSPTQDIRVRAAGQLANHQGRSVFERLQAHVEDRGSRLDRREAEALGRALALSDPALAGPMMEAWIRPKGFFKRMTGAPSRTMVQWTAVAAMAHIPGDQYDGALAWLAKRAGEDLAVHCRRTQTIRRRLLIAGKD